MEDVLDVEVELSYLERLRTWGEDDLGHLLVVGLVGWPAVEIRLLILVAQNAISGVRTEPLLVVLIESLIASARESLLAFLFEEVVEVGALHFVDLLIVNLLEGVELDALGLIFLGLSLVLESRKLAKVDVLRVESID